MYWKFKTIVCYLFFEDTRQDIIKDGNLFRRESILRNYNHNRVVIHLCSEENNFICVP